MIDESQIENADIEKEFIDNGKYKITNIKPLESNLKYFININQLAIIINNWDIDLIDAAIYDYMKAFIGCDNKKIQRLEIEGKSYKWIAYQKIINDMPILKIKSKDAIANRLNNLCEIGLLEKYTNKDDGNKTYFRLGGNSDKMEFIDLRVQTLPLPIENGNPSVSSSVTLTDLYRHNTYINDTTNYNTIKTGNSDENTSSLPKPQKEVKHKIRDNVLLTDKEYQEIKSKYSADEIEWMLDKLSNWKHQTGRKYKSDYHALNGWVKDTLSQKKEKENIPQKKELTLQEQYAIEKERLKKANA